MATEKIKLVRGDTRPQLKTVIRDGQTGAAVNIVGATVRMNFRPTGLRVSRVVLVGTLVAGLEMADGSVNSAAPYNVPGSGGRVVFTWAPGNLDVDPGDYEGEINVQFVDLTTQTVWESLKFKLRDSA